MRGDGGSGAGGKGRLTTVIGWLVGVLIPLGCTALGPRPAPGPPPPAFTEVRGGETLEAQLRAALAHVARLEPATLEEQIALTEIPAPPFGEQRRAAAYQR